MALVTNDDGAASDGLRTLAEAAEASGLEVLVVAPLYDASGSSASMTAEAEDGMVRVETTAGWPGLAVFGVAGPPALIVRAAAYGAFGAVPDVVLCGVNRGLNTGRAVVHSGTVMAALTAANYGCRAMAVSAESGPPERDLLLRALGWLAAAPDATVLNVNVPSPSATHVRATALADCGTVQGRMTGPAGASVPVVFDDWSGPPPAGTDAAAVAEGFVSVTALRTVVEDDRLDLPGLLETGDSRRPGPA